MGAVFIKILNMSITAGWIVLAVLFVRLLFKKKAPKALFPVLWGIVAIRLICPITFESNFSLIRNAEPVEQMALPEEVFSKPEEEQPKENKDTGNKGTASEDYIVHGPGENEGEGFYITEFEPIPGTIVGNNTEETINGTEHVEVDTKNEDPITINPSVSQEETDETIENTSIYVPTTDSEEIENNVTEKGNRLYTIVGIIWLTGIGSMLLYTVISYFGIYRRVKESVPLIDKVRVCDRIESPFILGVLRPRIYLPSDISSTDREYVIAHEMAHLKRFDHIWKPLGFLLLSVYWFHPLLWIAYILLCKDIEFACDEKVIKELGAEQKKTYSTALINCSVSRKMISACPLAFGENGVKGRVKSVLHYKKPAFWVLIASVLVCVVMAVCFLTNPKEKEHSPEMTPTPTPTVTVMPELTSVPNKEDENEISPDTGENIGKLTKRIENTKISIAIGDEYAAYLDENGKIHVLYDTSLIWEWDPVGATRGIDLTKTYKTLGTDPRCLVAIDEEGRPFASYDMNADELTDYVNKAVEEAMAAGGNYGSGGPQPWIAKDFEEMSGVKQIFSTYPYSTYTALFEDGTVYHYGEQEALEGAVQITKDGNGILAGIKADGTVIMSEIGDVLRKKKLDTWPKKLKQICAGSDYAAMSTVFIGLCEDGTVISEGIQLDYLINTKEKWNGIVKIAAANETVVGLKGDGTVVAVCPGRSDVGQCDVDDWTDVIAVNTNGKVTIGITKEGKVLMAGAVPELVKKLPERYNYEEIKMVFLEYMNHQAWLYPGEYPQESYTCSYELYRSETDAKTKYVYLKTVINDTEHWVSFEPDKYNVPTSPVRVVIQKSDYMRERLENGEIVSIGSDKLYIPAPTKPAYGNPVDLTNDISSIYSDLKQNGYRDNLRLEVIVSEYDLEKNLYPYVYLIINDSQVFETSFGELEGNSIGLFPLSRMFYYGNYTKDYTIEYGDGWPEVFDGHGIKPLDSVDTKQLERVKACASYHQMVKENSSETFLIDGQTIEIDSPNIGINEALGVRIAFLPQGAAAGSVYYNIYRSDDRGQSWRMLVEDSCVANGGFARILIPDKDTVVCFFEISGNTSQSSCIVSEDGGVTWNYATYPSKLTGDIDNPKIGTSVIFGDYEQDGDYSNGKEPLEWIVLDRDGDKALLLSKYGIETLLWDKDKTLESWEVDDLYWMMNRTIYEYAFSADERAALIKTTPIENESMDDYPYGVLQYPGYTFLLETDTVLEGKAWDGTPYFRTEDSRITIPTAYAAQKGAWLDKNVRFTEVAVPWIVTVTGTTDGDFSEVEFARVMPDGSISYEEEAIKEAHILIRPAIWVDVTKIPN